MGGKRDLSSPGSSTGNTERFGNAQQGIGDGEGRLSQLKDGTSHKASPNHTKFISFSPKETYPRFSPRYQQMMILAFCDFLPSSLVCPLPGWLETASQ